MQNRKLVIGVLGPIGVGKSTFSALLAKRLKLQHIEEKFPKNPFLEIFYKEPDRWSFDSQIHFLLSKIDQLSKLNPIKSYILDPCLEMDIIYALAQYKMGWMNWREKNLYLKIARILKRKFNVKSPDLILELNAPLGVLKRRILKRGRVYEMGLIEEPQTYLKALDSAISDYVRKDKKENFMKIDVSRDSFIGKSFMTATERKIRKKLGIL